MTVLMEKHGPVTTIVLNRPEVRNAVDRKTASALAEAFRDFEKDPEAKVAVLWGRGGSFCAGADLKAMAAEGGFTLTTDGDGPMGPTRMTLSKPTIAAISGFAVGGGLELAVWCDLRVVEETATLGVFTRRFGLPLVDGGTVRLPRLIGMSNALDLLLTGRGVNGAEAKAMGLANRLVPEGKAREEAEALAAQIAAFPQPGLVADRRSAYQQIDLPLADALVQETRLGMEAQSHPETIQGAMRFLAGAGRGGKS